ncbi:MAG: DUF421 domain-containing protein [Peptoniphilaceae bacterium]
MASIMHKIENLINQPNLLYENTTIIIRIAISGAIFYILLIVIMNLFGKRSMSNLSMYDYVTTLAMGSIVSSAIILKEVTIFNGLIGILILLLLQFIVTYISSYYPNLFNILNPNPSLLYLDGKFIEKNIRKNRITKNEIMAAIRMQGQTTSDNISAVILEANGTLSVIKDISEERKDEIVKFL